MTDTRVERLMSSLTPWMADGGLETTVVFHEGIDLPLFASFHLLESAEGKAVLNRYFDRYIRIAKEAGTGFVLDTATWRSGPFWAGDLGRSLDEMETVNRTAVAWALAKRDEHETAQLPILVNGVVGPAGDGYAPDALYTADRAEEVHTPQIRWMAEAGVDVISAVTFTHTGEAIGVVRAARKSGKPVVVSFTVETDGRLPTGQTLAEAIAETDDATGGAPIFYMVNCAHPDHFSGELTGDWTARLGGVRANASRMSHAELDAAEELDEGNPEEFGLLYGRFELPSLRLIGGCCGTDHQHIGEACRHLHLEAA